MNASWNDMELFIDMSVVFSVVKWTTLEESIRLSIYTTYSFENCFMADEPVKNMFEV